MFNSLAQNVLFRAFYSDLNANSLLSLYSCLSALACETDELRMAVTDLIFSPEDFQRDAEEIPLTSRSELAGEGKVSALQ